MLDYGLSYLCVLCIKIYVHFTLSIQALKKRQRSNNIAKNNSNNITFRPKSTTRIYRRILFHSNFFVFTFNYWLIHTVSERATHAYTHTLTHIRLSWNTSFLFPSHSCCTVVVVSHFYSFYFGFILAVAFSVSHTRTHIQSCICLTGSLGYMKYFFFCVFATILIYTWFMSLTLFVDQF